MGGGYSCLACLIRLTIDHASRSRRSAVWEGGVTDPHPWRGDGARTWLRGKGQNHVRKGKDGVRVAGRLDRC